MPSEADEVLVNYFVLCDQVITEAGSGKQSLIGVYSALMADGFPMQANLAVAIGLRVQSSRARELRFRLTGPTGEAIFASPALPYAWEATAPGIIANGFAAIQIGLNLRIVPFASPGAYTAALIVDGGVLATYSLSVSPSRPPATVN